MIVDSNWSEKMNQFFLEHPVRVDFLDERPASAGSRKYLMGLFGVTIEEAVAMMVERSTQQLWQDPPMPWEAKAPRPEGIRVFLDGLPNSLFRRNKILRGGEWILIFVDNTPRRLAPSFWAL